MAIKKFLLFVTPTETDRKTFVASFDSSDDAVETAKKLKGETRMRWQVIDTATARCVAEQASETMH